MRRRWRETRALGVARNIGPWLAPVFRATLMHHSDGGGSDVGPQTVSRRWELVRAPGAPRRRDGFAATPSWGHRLRWG